MLASTIVFFSDFLEEEKIEAISSRTTYEKILEIVWTLVPMITLVFISL